MLTEADFEKMEIPLGDRKILIASLNSISSSFRSMSSSSSLGDVTSFSSSSSFSSADVVPNIISNSTAIRIYSIKYSP